jgi:hypothetical protein
MALVAQIASGGGRSVGTCDIRSPMSTLPSCWRNAAWSDKYLYRAVDSTGQIIEILLTAKRDAAGARRFLRRALSAAANPVPRVINVDKNPAYPAAVEALKAEGILSRRVQLRQRKYLNNVVEQDHRTVKKRVWLAKGYGFVCHGVADETRDRSGKT